MSEANKAVVKGLYGELSKGNIDVIDSVFDDGFVEHEELPGLAPNKEGVKALFAMMRVAFPDLQMVPQQLIAEGDLVSVLALMTGTQRAEFMGIPATNKRVSVSLSDWMRVRNGKLTEHWGVMDMAALMQQLGVGVS